MHALNIVKTFKPDVCLLDIGLPAMDGYELARRLQQSKDLPAGARLIAVTGYGQDADERRTADAGFKGHLVKPVTFDDLTGALASSRQPVAVASMSDMSANAASASGTGREAATSRRPDLIRFGSKICYLRQREVDCGRLHPDGLGDPPRGSRR